METDVNYTVVGGFVIVLFAAIVLTIIWLSAGLSVSEYSIYKVYMTEAVTGLSLESPVEYNGVDVGSVKTISINHKNPRLVILLLKIKSTTPITKGTTASLEIKGLTGSSFISLKDQGKDLTPLTTPPGEDYPVINTVPSFFLKLDAALSSLTDSFKQLSATAHDLLDKENLRSIKDTLRNLDEITYTLSSNSKQINTVLHDTAKASAQLAPIFQNANQTMTDLSTLSRSLNELSEEISQNPAMLIRGKAPRPLGPGEQ